MDIDFSKMKLPPIYKRNGRECYLDPVRQKLIYITPEETVRQRIMSYLINDLNVPTDMIHVEEPLSHYNINTRDRADIIIDKFLEEDNVCAALAVIECKAPDVGFSEKDEFVSICMSSYRTFAKPDIVKTALFVAIDDEKASHHSLQMELDENLIVNGDECTFLHHGKITVGNKGAGKISDLRNLIEEKYPSIIDGNKFNLGTLICDHLWNLDEPDVMNLIENLISYALIRDEFRSQLLTNK